MNQCLKQDKHICLFIRPWPQAEFLQVLPKLTSVDFGIDIKLNSRLITLQQS